VLCYDDVLSVACCWCCCRGVMSFQGKGLGGGLLPLGCCAAGCN
jgi:hypothetical protein